VKILHILDHSLPVQSGYAFRSAAILREQANLGWSVLGLTGPKHGATLTPTERVDGITYHRVAAPRTWLSNLPAGGQIDVIRQLRAALRDLVKHQRPDILHAHSPCLNAIAAADLGVPLVYEMRSSWEDAAVSIGTTREGSLRYRLSRTLETHTLRRAAAVTVICNGLREEVLARGVKVDRVAVIPNAVDSESFSPSAAGSSETRRALGLDGAYVLGFIGSLFAWEGLGLLIEALPRMLSKRQAIRVLLVGSGVHEPALRAAVARLGLASQVVFAGQVPYARVATLYDAIDLLVYPRLPMRLTDMVTPLKPLEAMALGKAQVASDVGGHRELIIDGETGVLFRAGDAQALAAAVERVANDPSLAARLRANGPRYVREHRSWARVVGGYEPVYRAVLEAATP
jgi:PEP-CTERM/exosortase A-associated glycosyltransferase